MDAWHFTEMPYPHLPPLDTLSTMRVTLPSRHFDPKIGADLYNRYLDEYMIADDLGLNHHAQRASPDRDLHRRRRAAVRGHPGAPDQKGPHLHPRQSGRQPRRSGAHRRRDGDDRLHLARPARRRLRARRALRDLRGQHQSDADGRAAVGGHRPRGQGLDQPRRAVQLRRPLLAPARCQYLAAALSAAASAGLDHRLERPRTRSRRPPAAATCSRPSCSRTRR